MRIPLLLLFLLMPVVVSAQQPNDEAEPASVLGFKWFKDRRSIDYVDTSPTTPAPEMIPANKNFEKQRRINNPAGVRDPNADTLDGRSAELDRIVQESRESERRIDGFTYQAKIQNNSAKMFKMIFWEFQFKEKANPANVSRRQFVCLAKVKPEKSTDLEIFTLSAPTGVVSVSTLKNKASRDFDEIVIVNRVEYEDGSTWQRKDWNFENVKYTARPASKAQKIQPCRGL
jgi:hypothetical protein